MFELCNKAIFIEKKAKRGKLSTKFYSPGLIYSRLFKGFYHLEFIRLEARAKTSRNMVKTIL